jgi:hypothetical protein
MRSNGDGGQNGTAAGKPVVTPVGPKTPMDRPLMPRDQI